MLTKASDERRTVRKISSMNFVFKRNQMIGDVLISRRKLEFLFIATAILNVLNYKKRKIVGGLRKINSVPLDVVRDNHFF